MDLLGQLWSLPAAGGGAVPLTPAGEPARNPRFSPDGGASSISSGRASIGICGCSTSAARPAAVDDLAIDEREPDFTSDGSSVVFAANRTGHYCLWSIGIDDGVETQLTEEVGSASFPTVSEHGLVAYVLAHAGEWSIRVLGTDGAIDAVHTSSSRLSASFVAARRRRARLRRAGLGGDEPVQLLVFGEPRVLKSLTAGEVLFASRAAWRSAAEFVYAADGQLWGRGIALPTRNPVHLFAAAAVEVATPPNDTAALDDRAGRSAAGIDGFARPPDGRRRFSRRRATCGSPTAASGAG